MRRQRHRKRVEILRREVRELTQAYGLSSPETPWIPDSEWGHRRWRIAACLREDSMTRKDFYQSLESVATPETVRSFLAPEDQKRSECAEYCTAAADLWLRWQRNGRRTVDA